MNIRNSLLHFIFLAIPFTVGCKAREFNRTIGAKSASSEGESLKPQKIILFGDIQLAGEYRFNKELFAQQPIEKSILVNSPLRVGDFDEINPIETLRAENPDFLINSGDIVDLNNGQRFSVQDKEGKIIEQWKWEVDEWDSILKRFRPLGVPIFPTAGNHEGYGTVDWVFQREDDAKLRFIGAPMTGISGADRQSILLKQFPELTSNTVTFLPDSATYYSDQGQWCLLSLDVNNFAYPDKPLRQILSDKNALSEDQIVEWKKKYDGAIAKAESERQRAYEFAREKIASCNQKTIEGIRRPVIVLSHFPFFSGKMDLFKDDKGREKHGAEFHDEGIRKMFVSLFDELDVPLVISAHEHFYLRYLDQGFQMANYVRPKSTTYLNTSTFGGSFTAEGADRILKLGRLNEAGKVYDSLESTPMMMADGKALRIKTGPTYTSLLIKTNSLRITSNYFNESKRSWETFDSFEIYNSNSERWARREISN